MSETLPINQLHEDGIILVNKPLTWTSFDVVNKVRFLLKGKKTGHAGTLDPLASGLVILCTGKATKQIDTIQSQEKVYTGSICLGAVTDSFDKETEPRPLEGVIMPSEEQIKQATLSFIGEIDQVPPAYSAIKVDGKRAYKYAREGLTVEIKSRKVTVFEFEITEIKLPEVFFRIRCSKGTYIRTIANDFGAKLGTGAYLSSLCRTRIGNYKLEDAFTIDSLIELLDKK